MIAVLLALAMALTTPASAQTAPSGKPITMVVPFPPGPSLDLVARLTGAKLAGALGQPVVVENRTGANGTLGANAIARAAPDGHTLLFTTASTQVTAMHADFQPLRDEAHNASVRDAVLEEADKLGSLEAWLLRTLAPWNLGSLIGSSTIL